jgi:hypothetical protein
LYAFAEHGGIIGRYGTPYLQVDIVAVADGNVDDNLAGRPEVVSSLA